MRQLGASTRCVNSLRQLAASTRCVNSLRQLAASTRCVNSLRQLVASTRCLNSLARQLDASARELGIGWPSSRGRDNAEPVRDSLARPLQWDVTTPRHRYTSAVFAGQLWCHLQWDGSGSRNVEVRAYGGLRCPFSHKHFGSTPNNTWA